MLEFVQASNRRAVVQTKKKTGNEYYSTRDQIFLSSCSISHFTIVCLVTWPFIGDETGVTVLLQTSLFFICNDLHMKSSECTLTSQSERELKELFLWR